MFASLVLCAAAVTAQLPDDDGKMYLTVVDDGGQVADMFSGDERLRSFRDRTRFNRFTTGSRRYREYWGRSQQSPQVCLQLASGRVLYYRSGENVPNDSTQLFWDLAKSAKQALCPNCPRRRADPVQPAPQPAPQPQPAEPLPDLDPQPQPPVDPVPAPSRNPTWLIVAVGVLAAGLGFVFEMRRRVSN